MPPVFLAAAVLLTTTGMSAASELAPIRVLIVDGFGNHDWQRTTRMICGILDPQPGFHTTVSTAPGHSGDPASWNPEFSRWKDEADPVDMRCAGFQTLVVRSLQWLAKREVTAAVPADFPSASATSLRPPVGP